MIDIRLERAANREIGRGREAGDVCEARGVGGDAFALIRIEASYIL